MNVMFKLTALSNDNSVILLIIDFSDIVAIQGFLLRGSLSTNNQLKLCVY